LASISYDKKPIKIVLLGDGGVGKTTLMQRYARGYFIDSTKETIGLDIHVPFIRITEKIGIRIIQLTIWDLGGQEQFKQMGVFDKFCKGADGAIVMFDTTRLSTIDSISEWIELYRKNTNYPSNIILTGTKVDLSDIYFDCKEFDYLNQQYGIKYYLNTSSNTGEGIDQLFKTLIKEILSKHEIINVTPEQDSDKFNKLFTAILKLKKDQAIIELKKVLEVIKKKEIKDNITEIKNLLYNINKSIRYVGDMELIALMKIIKGRLLIEYANKLTIKKKYPFYSSYIDGLSDLIDACEYAIKIAIPELIDETLFYIFEFFNKIILYEEKVNEKIDNLNNNRKLIVFGHIYGDHFFNYLWNAINLLNNNDYQLYKSLMIAFENIERISTKEDKRRKLIIKIHKKLIEKLHPIMVINETMEPNPHKYGEQVFAIITLVNITNKIIQTRTLLETGITEKRNKNRNFKPNEEFKFVIPLGKIEAEDFGYNFDLQIKKNDEYHSIRNQLISSKGKAKLAKPILQIISPIKESRWKRSGNIKLLATITNPSNKPLNIALSMNKDWGETITNFPLVKIGSKKERTELITIQNPPKENFKQHTIVFKLIDEKGIEYHEVKKLVNIKMKKSGRTLFIEILGHVINLAGKSSDIINKFT